MAKYQITHACGHTSTAALFGKSNSRDYRISKLEQEICSDCWKSEQIKQDKLAAEKNATCGLPELLGSEKQILWSEKIRADKLALIDSMPTMPSFQIDAYWQLYVLYGFMTEDEIDAINESKTPFLTALELPILQKGFAALRAQTRAAWWIDNRDYKLSSIIRDLLKSLPVEQPAENKALELDAQIEATVSPEYPVTNTIAEIRTHENAITVHFPEKREDFREVVKLQLGYEWVSNCWKRSLNSQAGSVADRTAELGNVLLGNGFIIRIYDESIRNNAISGDFEPEQTRWISLYTSGSEQGRLCIKWGRDCDYYKAAKRLPTAKYSKPHISVAVEQFEQILDFAECNGFDITQSAQQALEDARITKEKLLTVQVPKAEKPKRKSKAKDKPIKLDVPENVGVDNDLRD